MKAYIAAPYPLREQAIQLMHDLESIGIIVTSRWLKAPDEMSDEHARKDLADVAEADVLVALNPSEWADKGTGGRHVELGYALALNKQIVLVGKRTNIFHHLSGGMVVDRIDALAFLWRMANAQLLVKTCSHQYWDMGRCIDCFKTQDEISAERR